MFKNQIKEEMKSIYYSNMQIENQIIGIKVSLHTLEKLGVDTTEMYKQIDNVGIEVYKLKNKAKEMFENE